MRPLRLPQHYSEAPGGYLVRLDCGHELRLDRRATGRERYECSACPAGSPHTPAPRGPLMAVQARGLDRDGDYEKLACGHVLHNVRGKPAKRRCPRCLEEAQKPL